MDLFQDIGYLIDKLPLLKTIDASFGYPSHLVNENLLISPLPLHQNQLKAGIFVKWCFNKAVSISQSINELSIILKEANILSIYSENPYRKPIDIIKASYICAPVNSLKVDEHEDFVRQLSILADAKVASMPIFGLTSGAKPLSSSLGFMTGYFTHNITYMLKPHQIAAIKDNACTIVLRLGWMTQGFYVPLEKSSVGSAKYEKHFYILEALPRCLSVRINGREVRLPEPAFHGGFAKKLGHRLRFSIDIPHTEQDLLAISRQVIQIQWLNAPLEDYGEPLLNAVFSGACSTNMVSLLNLPVVQITLDHRRTMKSLHEEFANPTIEGPYDYFLQDTSMNRILSDLNNNSCSRLYDFCIPIGHKLHKKEVLSFIKSKIGSNNDQTDLLTDNWLLVTLKCPINMTRIDVPVRGFDCDHLQCWDLHSYLVTNFKRPRWRCPICDQPCPYRHLRKDELFAEILSDSNMKAVTYVKIDVKGQFCDKDSSNWSASSLSTNERESAQLPLVRDQVLVEDSVIVLSDDEEEYISLTASPTSYKKTQPVEKLKPNCSGNDSEEKEDGCNPESNTFTTETRSSLDPTNSLGDSMSEKVPLIEAISTINNSPDHRNDRANSGESHCPILNNTIANSNNHSDTDISLADDCSKWPFQDDLNGVVVDLLNSANEQSPVILGDYFIHWQAILLNQAFCMTELSALLHKDPREIAEIIDFDKNFIAPFMQIFDRNRGSLEYDSSPCGIDFYQAFHLIVYLIQKHSMKSMQRNYLLSLFNAISNRNLSRKSRLSVHISDVWVKKMCKDLLLPPIELLNISYLTWRLSKPVFIESITSYYPNNDDAFFFKLHEVIIDLMNSFGSIKQCSLFLECHVYLIIASIVQEIVLLQHYMPIFNRSFSTPKTNNLNDWRVYHRRRLIFRWSVWNLNCSKTLETLNEFQKEIDLDKSLQTIFKVENMCQLSSEHLDSILQTASTISDQDVPLEIRLFNCLTSIVPKKRSTSELVTYLKKLKSGLNSETVTHYVNSFSMSQLKDNILSRALSFSEYGNLIKKHLEKNSPLIEKLRFITRCDVTSSSDETEESVKEPKRKQLQKLRLVSRLESSSEDDC